jgi:leucine-rich repeat protein SHOC2
VPAAHGIGTEALSESRKYTLPKPLGRLVSLQWLRLVKGYRFKSLPASLGDLASLRELMLHGCYSLIATPETLGRLVTLQTILG